MAKKLSVLLLCPVLLCILFLFSPALAFNGGSGTLQDPYLISSEEQLKKMSEDLSKSYALASNIMLTESWTPIGDDLSPFQGNFDGQGYEISGLNVNLSDDAGFYGGLFGYVSGSNISNLTVSGSVSVSTEELGTSFAGGIVGFMDSGSITNCRNLCSVEADGLYSAQAGGIVGFFMGSEIERCCNEGDIYSISTTAMSGGIVGYADIGITCVDCYNTASVTAVSFAADGIVDITYAGGIAANGNALRCYNTGTISAQSESYCTIVGSITGCGDYIDGCYYLSGTADAGVGEYYGVTEANAKAASEDELKEQSTFADFDFENTWTMNGDRDYPYPELIEVQRNITVTSIQISALPTKLEYIQGEALDLTGGEITVKYSDLSTKKFSLTSDMVSAFDSSTPGDKTLSVSCSGFTASFTVSVKAKTLLSLELDNPPDLLVYPRNGTLDLSGMKLTAKYDNGESEDVTSLASISSFSSALPGEYTVTAQYGGKSVDFSVYVFGFSEISLSLEGSVSINFYASFPGMDKAGYEPCILFFKEAPNDNDVLSAYRQGNFSENWIQSNDKFMVSYKNIAAREMSDDIYAVLCAQTEAGPVFSPASSTSVARYASQALQSYSDKALQQLMVDMLNYGAAAQLYFNYNADSLANAALNEEQLALGTSSLPVLSSITQLYDDGLADDDVSLLSASLSLDNEISANIYAAVQNGCPAPKLLTFESYTAGKAHSVNEAKSASDMVQSDESYAGFIPNIAPRYFRMPYYARVYAPTESGDAYSKLLCYSVESYAASVINGNYAQSFKDLMNEMMNYGDSAAAYFGR